MNVESPAHAQAIEWHIRLRHGDDATWAAFAAWLAEDPAHALAYDAVEQADDAVGPLLPEVDFRQAANDAAQTVPVRAPIRWRMIGGGIAASLAGLLTMSPYLASGRYDVATGPGEHRIVKLDATTQITLNGATRMKLDHKDPRFAALAEGEAFFQVRHDAGHPFHLEIGTDRLVDIGTEFNVTRDAGETRVDVAEGEVAYITKTATTPLTAGASLAVRATSGQSA